MIILRTVASLSFLTLALACPPATNPVEEGCAKLCDRTVLCTEKVVAPRIAAEDTGGSPDDFTCSFDDSDGARDTCQEGCVKEGESPTAEACIQCLSQHMSCTTTASMRQCDVDCEPTLFATGHDGEGALEYDYASWFFADISQLEGMTCEEDG